VACRVNPTIVSYNASTKSLAQAVGLARLRRRLQNVYNIVFQSKVRQYLEGRHDVIKCMTELQNFENTFLPNALRWVAVSTICGIVCYCCQIVRILKLI
jgi:hypothetical protein